MFYNIWDDSNFLYSAEIRRIVKRSNNNEDIITFDCYNLGSKNEKAYCKKGYVLDKQAKDGNMSLASILAGRTSSVCKHCKDFNGGEINEQL